MVYSLCYYLPMQPLAFNADGLIPAIIQDATTKDVLELIELVQSRVYERFDVNLELEVVVWK